MTELHPTLLDIAPGVAQAIYRRYRGYVEKEDVLQECYLWATSRNNSFIEQLNEENSLKRIANERRIAWQMKRHAERYARKEKASKSGYMVNDEAYYEDYTIAQLLPYVIKCILNDTPFEQGQQMIDDGQPKRPSAPAESGNLIAMMIDIKRGYLKLEPGDQSLLTQRYYHEWTLQQIANHWECAVSTADRRCENALKRLQDELGGVSPWS